ncbi:MAG TPA: PLP-dependent transferase [Longimicrobiales bacterium]|nr:PLP-dependent transferase [Longimicrobiales bacterium]
MKFETLAVHAGQHVDESTGAVTSPIHLSTTFEREPDGSYRSGYVYSRADNPNRKQLEECLALLEGGAGAVAFSSGSAATAALFQSLEPGQHVVAPYDAYYGTPKILADHFARWGLEFSLVDCGSSEWRSEIRDTTSLIWLESPSNPLIRVTDIAAVCAVAKERGIRVAVDNTWATPVLQRPLELGADYVIHSTTKYLGGHSDVIGGVVIAKQGDESYERLRMIQKDAGAVPSPFDCWLVMRGVKTLPYRMRAHSANAVAVAEFLRGHQAVSVVHYPGWGGMLSFEVKGGRAEALQVAGATGLFTRATSLGGSESLIEHRASVEGVHTRAPESLLRCSIGLEHPDDIIDDLRQALETIR